MTDQARACLREGRLGDAIAAQTAAVRLRPTDVDVRGLLAELFCFSGDLDRADRQLEVIASQAPTVIGTALFRQILRAERARRECFSEGRLPEFLAPPPEHIECHLRALLALREGDAAVAKELIAEADALRPAVAGVCDGVGFQDWRDLDDLTAGFLEVLTSTGKYYWVPLEQVISLEFRRPEHERDLLWRRAGLTLRQGPEGEVFVPATYWISPEHADDELRLGRRTDWLTHPHEPVRGVGLRTYLAGERDLTILDITRIDMQEASASS